MDDVQNLILEEVRNLGRKLDQHIKDESHEFASIRKDINQLKIDSALNKERIGLFSAGISTIVAGVWAFLSAWFGK